MLRSMPYVSSWDSSPLHNSVSFFNINMESVSLASLNVHDQNANLSKFWLEKQPQNLMQLKSLCLPIQQPVSGPDFMYPANIRGSWVYVKFAPPLVSHCVTGGTIGAHDKSIPSHAVVSGPVYLLNVTKTNCRKMAISIIALIKSDLFYSTLSSIP